MILRRLKPAGIDIFKEYLELLRIDSTRLPPTEILEDPDLTETLSESIEVSDFAWATRLELSRYLDKVLSQTSLNEIETDVGLWSWLSLFLFEIICPKSSTGFRKPRELTAYIPEPNNFKRYYRHLLLGAYLIYRANRDDPDRALGFLCKAPHVIDDVVAQIAARQEYITNRSVVELVTKLYVDSESRTTKRGAGGKGGGSPRRLADVLSQFDVTWDLYAMTTTEFLRVLPKEFERFTKTTAG